MLSSKLSRFILGFSILLPAASLTAQADVPFLAEYKASYLQMSAKARANPDSVGAQLMLTAPGPTVTTAFGHVALRVYTKLNDDTQDFYVDFGNYEESVAFVRKFLSGSALFYTKAIPTTMAIDQWAVSGRGVITYKLVMTREEKARFLVAVEDAIKKTEGGYTYHNFRQNCVTYIRDILEKTYATPIELNAAHLAEGDTWRARVVKYSRAISWLQLGENYWFNYLTDQKKNGRDVVYLPYDLYQAVVDGGHINGDRVVLKDRWAVRFDRQDWSGWLFIVVFAIGFLLQLAPGSWGTRGRASVFIFSGFTGLVVWVVTIFTEYDFMARNALFFAVCPFDFALLSNRVMEKIRPWLKPFAFARAGLWILALVICLILPQKSFTALALSGLAWSCFLISVLRGER